MSPDPAQQAQARRALARGRWLVAARAEVKRGLKAGLIDAPTLIAGDDERFEEAIVTWRLDELLKAIPTFGEQTVAEFLEEVRLPPRGTLQSLTYERRGELADLVHLALHNEPRRIVPQG